MKFRIGKFKKFLIFVFWILVWQIAATIISDELIFPSPVATGLGLISLFKETSFYLDAFTTIARCIAAMLLSAVLGLALSIAAYKSRLLKEILAFPVAFFKSVPVMAVAIYMILIMTAGSVPIFVCFVMCFPIVYTNLLTGLENMDVNLLEMADVYGIRGNRLVKHVYIPSLYPYFSSAISLIAGMSWKAIVTAEVLSIPKFSLGYELMNSKYYLNTDLLFAYVIVIIALSLAFEKLIKLALDRAKPKSYSGSKVSGLITDADTKSRLDNDLNIESNSQNKFKNKIADSIIENNNLDSQLKNSNSIIENNNLNSDFDLVVELKNVSKSFSGKKILQDFSLELSQGSKVAVMGASGSGKTTLLRLISGLEKADSGKVVNRAKKTAVLFQEDRLLPWLNVYDNLAIVNSDSERIRELLVAVELENDANKLPSELSGGMRFRLAMARLFIYNPDLLLVDEAFQGLDDETKARIIDKLWKREVPGKTVLLVTHSDEDAKLADRTIEIGI